MSEEAETILILKYGDMLNAVATWLRCPDPDELFTPDEQLAIADYFDKRFSNLKMKSVEDIKTKYGKQDD